MRQRYAILAALAAAAILAYLPVLHQPLLEDDYPNIVFANRFGPVAGWSDLVHAPAFRLRATYQLLTAALYANYDMTAPAYYAASLVLHVLNTWLVFALGTWKRIGYAASAWGALFFAVSEGHQEAVMWTSASSELLQFLFGVTAVICWVRFLQGSRWWYLASIAAFALALISKESAPIFLALMILPILLDHRGKAAWLAPFVVLTTLAAWSIFFPGSDSFRFRDGSFSLHAPFWLTFPRSFFGLLWFWGLLALIAGILWIRDRAVFWIALAWAAIGLVPYSFLTYSTRIPSRQTYLASAGVAILFGAAFIALKQKQPRLAPALVAIVVLTNVGYLWTKKRAQFLERAAPTEQLIALSRQTKGLIYVACFPRPREVAEQAVSLVTGRPPSQLIWDARNSGQAAATFCYVSPTR